MRRIEMTDPAATKQIGLLLIPGMTLMTYACLVEPLRIANLLSAKQLYRWWNIIPPGESVHLANGVVVQPEFTADQFDGHLDVIFLCAGNRMPAYEDRATFALLRRLDRHGTVIGGISAGPYILAQAGLMGGYRSAVHWDYVAAMTEKFLDVDIVPSLYDFDRNRVTCAGGVAALDMMIALIEGDHGHKLAAAVGDVFVHTQIRAGREPHRMDVHDIIGVRHPELATAIRKMEEALEAPLSRQALAASCRMSVRRLERVFRKYLQCGIHEHYLSLRLNRAQQLLRGTSLSLVEIAQLTGFNSATNFSRAFRRRFGTAPSTVRKTHLRLSLATASVPLRHG